MSIYRKTDGLETSVTRDLDFPILNTEQECVLILPGRGGEGRAVQSNVLEGCVGHNKGRKDAHVGQFGLQETLVWRTLSTQ